MEVVDAEKLKVGAGEYLNSYYQLKDVGNSTNKQQVILDDNLYNTYLQKDDVKWRNRKQINNKKSNLQKAGMEMM